MEQGGVVKNIFAFLDPVTKKDLAPRLKMKDWQEDCPNRLVFSLEMSAKEVVVEGQVVVEVRRITLMEKGRRKISEEWSAVFNDVR